MPDLYTIQVIFKTFFIAEKFQNSRTITSIEIAISITFKCKKSSLASALSTILHCM